MTAVSRRAQAREVVLQLLYQDDLNPRNNPAVGEDMIARRLKDPDLIQFATDLLAGVRKKQAEIDRRIGEVTQHWSLQRMAATDRNVLRLAVYELYHTATPERVVIDQAIELAKRFGSEQSGSFINGILDRLMHEKGGDAKDVPGDPPA